MTAGAVEIAWGAATDRGLRRPVNEDGYLAQSPLFLVADGMGGHEAGAEASRRALDGFAQLIGRRSVTVDEFHDAFERAVDGVDAIDTDRFAAGTTLSGAALCEHAGATYWLIINIGDSRTYRMISGELAQVSVDHSAVQALIDRGELTAEAAALHAQRNVVTRAVGAGSTEPPDYWLVPAVAGERILVCSDGLTKELDDPAIAAVLRAESAPQAAATRLVHEALLRGGRDNVTVVVVDAHHVVEADDDPTAPSGTVGEDTRPRREEGADRVQL